MVPEIDRLAAEWVHWTLAAGMAGRHGCDWATV